MGKVHGGLIWGAPPLPQLPQHLRSNCISWARTRRVPCLLGLPPAFPSSSLGRSGAAEGQLQGSSGLTGWGGVGMKRFWGQTWLVGLTSDTPAADHPALPMQALHYCNVPNRWLPPAGQSFPSPSGGSSRQSTEASLVIDVQVSRPCLLEQPRTTLLHHPAGCPSDTCWKSARQPSGAPSSN